MKIIIADDMEEYRNHFKMLLDNEHDMSVVATANGKEDLIKKAKKYKPDVILMDIQMEEDDSGIQATKEIMEILPQTRIIMLTIHGNRENILAAYEAGAVDFVKKTASSFEIIRAIRDASNKESIESKPHRIIVDEFIKLKSERNSMLYVVRLLSKLSMTEVSIIKAVAEGKKYREIAEEKHVEEVTIRSMASKICAKMDIKPLKELVETLKRLGIMDIIYQLDKDK